MKNRESRGVEGMLFYAILSDFRNCLFKVRHLATVSLT